MLTRKTALARLRATGTLSAATPKANIITREQANSAPARDAAQVIRDNSGRAGKRFLAPSPFHAVLP
ncbi:MAG: hypothetical protein H7Z39_16420 [Burkholderiaceae bacterium]|nr:hypothetical protein [Burkholderiaceae bacterium]